MAINLRNVFGRPLGSPLQKIISTNKILSLTKTNDEQNNGRYAKHRHYMLANNILPTQTVNFVIASCEKSLVCVNMVPKG